MKYPHAKIKHILRYAIERLKEYKREMEYRFYVTDALKVITENTQKVAGGAAMQKRFADIMSNQVSRKNPTVEKSPEEIIEEVNKRAGLKVM